MKVLHVLHTSLPYIAGYCIRSDQIIRNTMRQGIECVAVTSAQHPNAEQAVEEIEGVRYYRTTKARVPAVPGLREGRLMSLLHDRLTAVIEREKPDLIHAHSPVLVGFPALRAARSAGLPLVYEVRDLWENALVDRGRFGSGSLLYQAARRFETYLLNRADHVVTISKQLADEVSSRRSGPSNVTVVGNGVDLEQLQKRLADAAPADLGFRNDWPVIGYLGTFQPYEGLRTLMDAYRALRQSGTEVNLAIIGGGGEEAALRSYAAATGIASEIFMPGKVPVEEVARYYNSIDVFVYPRIDSATTRLTTPLKPLEAMTAEKLVCVSDLPAMRELVTDSETGRVFSATDSTSLARILCEQLQCPTTARRLAHNAREWVEKHRNWQSLAEKYLPIYEGCLTGGVRR